MKSFKHGHEKLEWKNVDERERYGKGLLDEESLIGYYLNLIKQAVFFTGQGSRPTMLNCRRRGEQKMRSRSCAVGSRQVKG